MNTLAKHEIEVVSFNESAATRKDGYYSGGKWYRTSAGDRVGDPMRVFVDFKGETIWDNLNNRTQRPSTQLKPIVEAALFLAGIEHTKIRWSQKAGCRMCPCSPGFIIEGTTWDNRKDFWLTVADKTEYETRPELFA
jgi:hypothetical protein